MIPPMIPPMILLMILLPLASPARAHGGEDHGAPAAAAVVSPDGLRAPLSSASLDAVLVLPPAPAAVAQSARLLVADAATGAPVSLTSAALSLSGPAQAAATFSGAGGIHSGVILLPAPGDYAGSLVLEAAGQTDLLAVTGVRLSPIDPPAGAPDGASTRRAGIAAAAGLALAALAFAAGFGLGRSGRWRGAGGAAILGLAGLTASRVAAHGGEDHGAPATTAPASTLSLPMESQFLLGLRTVRVYAAPFQPATLGLGALTAAPGGAATLRAPVAGTISAVDRQAGGWPLPGSLVRAGQVLALIRESPSGVDRAALGMQRADAGTRLAEARAALRLAERDAAQLTILGKALSAREILEWQNAVEVARVAVREAERLAGGERSLTVTAPLSGRLSPGAARPGDQVSAGDELFHIVSDRALWVRARVPESKAGPITAGGTASVTLPALPGRSFPAVVLDGGVESDPETGTVTVTLALEPDGALRPGLSATAWIVTGATEDVITVPDDAVVESDGIMLVFVKTGPERFEARAVTLGARSGAIWEVHAGLQPGDRVVVSGTYALKSLAGR